MTFRLMAVISLVVGLVVSAASAQEKPAPDQRRSTNASPSRPAETVTGPIRAAANIQVELTISDSVGSGGPQKKSISMTIADRRMGRIRSTRSATAVLNVDATPTIADGNRLQLQLTLEYLPEQTGESPPRIAPINEMITVVLESGKPMVVSQAADPSTDRRVTVEVKGTILK